MGRKSKSVFKFRHDPRLECPQEKGVMERMVPCWKCPIHEDCLQQFNMTFLFFGDES